MAELERLSRSMLSSPDLVSAAVALPQQNLLDLPERAIQFGTGAFLRGFVEYFLDAANRAGAFGGRVVAVASTSSGRNEVVNEQDGLYTLVAEGIEHGRPYRNVRIVGSLSRALSAATDWNDVLALARDPNVDLIFSNTTEVGIALDDDDQPASPPRSFPGKLTMFLAERARALRYSADKPVTVIPCELIEQNGERLREIVVTLAERWSLGAGFRAWLEHNVLFCNTLVDRIVSGTPGPERRQLLEQNLGYRDELLTICEPYRLFAIEARRDAYDRFPFANADQGVILTEDVEPFRLRKVRLLNGAHSLLAPLGLECGVDTVFEAVTDETVGEFLRRVMFDELVPASNVSGAREFASDVLDRFANPYMEHALIGITLHGTAKIRVRVVPSIVEYAKREGRPPELTTFAFAAFLFFLRGDVHDRRRADGLAVPKDDGAVVVRELWDQSAGDGDYLTFVQQICGDESLWGEDLRVIPGFVESVAANLSAIVTNDVRASLAQLLSRSPTPIPVPQ